MVDTGKAISMRPNANIVFLGHQSFKPCCNTFTVQLMDAYCAGWYSECPSLNMVEPKKMCSMSHVSIFLRQFEKQNGTLVGWTLCDETERETLTEQTWLIKTYTPLSQAGLRERLRTLMSSRMANAWKTAKATQPAGSPRSVTNTFRNFHQVNKPQEVSTDGTSTGSPPSSLHLSIF
jgi:hypothetical protein